MNIAVLGYGTVGKGVVEIVDSNDSDYKVTAIFARETYRDVVGQRLKTDIAEILNDVSIDIIVEVLGGEDFAYECIKKALAKGKHVVTANKNVISKHFKELTQLAEANQVALHYEASVGGGTPVIQTIIKTSATDDVSSVSGVVNGTANFILTQMTENSVSLDQALSKARENGFAEQDATDDLEGFDAARKLSILATIAFKQPLTLKDVQVSGITNVTPEIINDALTRGYHIKHIVTAEISDQTLSLRCEAAFVNESHPFYYVDNEVNSISIVSKYNHKVTLTGFGAGSLPTASAVVSDIYLISKAQYYRAKIQDDKTIPIDNKPSAAYYLVSGDKVEIKQATQYELENSSFYALVVD